MSEHEEEVKKSGFGTASLVLGIIAICFSFIPIISYISFILGVLALAFAIASLVKKASKGQAIAGLILAIIALFMAYSMHNGLKTAIDEVSSGLNELSNEISSSFEVDQDSEDKMTLAKFNEIENGMTYSEVVKIIGSEGTLSTESSYGGTTMQIYYWYASNGISNASISFTNGKVTAKSQIGLD